MSKNLQVENAGMAREVDMFDKKKGVLDMVGKIKPKGLSDLQVPKADKKLDTLDKKSDNQEKPFSDEGNAQKKKKKSKNDKEHDILSESDISEAVKEIPISDDASEFRFDEFEEPLSDRKEIKEKSEGTKKLLESVQSVEDRLKNREQINLTMMSIEIANLPSAHRFTKNMPWLKGSYGLTYSWVAEYEESSDGTSASWKNLRWSFNLERNNTDRNDLVITVCSKNLILGRYVLGKHEFIDIPNTKTGYFEVTGDIMSGIGIAGKIRILFLKSKADRPKGPSKPVLPSQITAAHTAALNPLKQMLLQQKHLYVKVLSAAVMDLKSVHFLDVNSPFIAVEVGDWVGVSDTAYNAGMAARWNNLNWKFTVTMETGVHLVIHSKNTLIGRMHVSLEEIASAEAKKNNVLEIIKHITDGKDVTGKVKLNLLAEVPPKQQQLEESMGNTGATGSSVELEEGAVKTLDAEGNILEAGDRVEAEKQQPHALLTTLSSQSMGQQLATGTGTTAIAAATAGISDLAPLKPFMRVPFQINVHEVTLLDTIKAQYFRTNSLSVNVVCGPWGKATNELPSSGSYAHWINLKWKIPVKGSNNLRITAWSHGKAVGAANISVSELLEMPTDYEHNTEIFAKLLNEKKEIVGKVKLSCKYESLVSVINNRIVAITTTNTTAEEQEHVNTSPDTKRANFVPNIGSEKPKNVSFFHESNEEDDDLMFADGAPPWSPSHKQTATAHIPIVEPLSLPIVANIRSISVYDAISVHTFKRNAPYIKFICDRKSATTVAIKNAGPVATWSGLNWLMKIRADSHVVAVLYSGDVEIGRVEFRPQDLLTIPVNDDGHTEIKTLFKKEGSTTAKLHVIANLKSLEDVIASPSSDHPFSRASERVIQSAGVIGSTRRGQTGLQYGNTAGGLDGISTASFSEKLPPLQSERLGSPQTYTGGGGSVYGGSVSQRVPTLPSVYPQPARSAMSQSFSHPGQTYGGVAGSPAQGNGGNWGSGMGSPGSETDPRFHTWGSTLLQQQQVIFDRNLMSAENADKLGLSFHVAIQEIDLIDLPAAHLFGKNCPYVSAACGKWTAATEPIENAGDTAFWTKLNWHSTCRSGGNLRLIVTSKKVVLGACTFSTENLLNAVSDDKGLRRVNAAIVSEKGERQGRIKVAYTLDVVTKSALNSPPQQRAAYNAGARGFSSSLSVGPGQSTRGFSPGGTGSPGTGAGLFDQQTADQQSVRASGKLFSPVQPAQYPYDLGDDSFYDELIDPDPRRNVDFPFNIHILELSTLDLQSVHQFSRNQPIVKAFCDTFYSETKAAGEYADVTYFRELHWIFPVRQRSIFKLTVSSREKDVGSVVVDLMELKSIPFDPAGMREMVLTVQDQHGRPSGKVRMLARLSNVATNDYDFRNSLDQDLLGMDGVSVPGGGASAFFQPSATAGSHRSVASLPATVAVGGATVLSNRRGSTGMVSAAGGASVRTGSVPHVGGSYGKDFEYLLASQADEPPLELAEAAVVHCTLVGIAAIDLRSAHTFAPNSPTVNIACGKVITTTPVAENAGKMAHWEDLSIRMPLEASSTLRVLLSSGDKVIGQTAVQRGKLLGGRRNQKGLYVLFGELEHQDRAAGKVKFVYALEGAPTAPGNATAGIAAVGGGSSVGFSGRG